MPMNVIGSALGSEVLPSTAVKPGWSTNHSTGANWERRVDKFLAASIREREPAAMDGTCFNETLQPIVGILVCYTERCT